jgi:hypothetical protein
VLDERYGHLPQGGGDAFVNYESDNKRHLIDVTVTSPTPESPAGTAAQAKVLLKTKLYMQNYQIDPRELLIFAMEFPGRVNTEGRMFMKGLARRAAEASGDERDEVRTITSMYQRIAVALQRGNAAMLANYVTSCVGVH